MPDQDGLRGRLSASACDAPGSLRGANPDALPPARKPGQAGFTFHA
jgi:hypothetical protein